MAHRSVELTLRSSLLNSTSSISLSRARMAILPIVFGAAMSLGIGYDTKPVMAAVTCSPVASGGALTGDTSCSGSGNDITYTSATGDYVVALNGAFVEGAGATGISITQSGYNVSLLDIAVSNVDTTASAGAQNGIFMTGGGNVIVNLLGTTVAGDSDGINLST